MINLNEQIGLLGNSIMVTTNTEQEESVSDLDLSTEAKEALLSNVQTVVATGPLCVDIKVGDVVRIKVGEILIPKQFEERIPGSEKDRRAVTKMVLDENKFFNVGGVDYMMIPEYFSAFTVKDPTLVVQ